MPAALARAAATLTAALALLASPAAAKPPPPAPTSVGGVISASACGDCRTGLVKVAGGPFGSFLAAWPDGSFRVFRRLFDADGNGGADTQVGTSTQADLGGVAGDGDGWVLEWFQPGQVFAQRVGADGGTEPATRLNDAGRGDDHGTAAAAAGDGVLAVWSRSTPGDALDQVVARHVDRSGVPTADEQVLGELIGRTSSDACGFANGRSVVVWTTYAGPSVDGQTAATGVSLRRVAADGSPLGAVQGVATPTLTAFTTAPTVACRPDGSFVVAWNSNRPPAKNGFDVLWQRFDANGKAKGKAAALSATTGGDELEPALLALPDGRVLAVWNDADGSGGGVLTGRWIGANGKPTGSDFPLRRSEPGMAPHHPRLTLLPATGRFVLGWWEDLRGRVEVFAF